MAWVHTGGGCMLAGMKKHPCDDAYKNERNGERVTFYTTPERHFNMPSKVSSLGQIKRLKGVGRMERRGARKLLNGLGSWG